MRFKRVAVLAPLLFLLLPWGTAQAYWRVGVGIGVPVYRPYYRVGVVVAPAPVYVGPVVPVYAQPVYVQPAPVYVQQPVPVYVQQPAAVAPAPGTAAPAPEPVRPPTPAK
jgi:hypothetical protein